MAEVDRTSSLLPADEFRRIIGYNPWHFWQLANDIVPVKSSCNTLVKQYAWQDADAAGRADIIEAIITAEDKLSEYLGFSPAPRYETEDQEYSKFYDPHNQYLASIDSLGRWLSLRLNRGKVLNIGSMTRSLIGSPAVVLSDTDGDGLKETFTLAIATTVTDVEEVAVYFGVADRFYDSEISERWRIRPISISIGGGIATVTGKVWNIVRPVLYENTNVIDPSVAGNFAAALDVYHIFTDTTQQGSFVWETSPLFCSTTTDGSTDPYNVAILNSKFVVRDWELGYIAGETAILDATTGKWNSSRWGVLRPPERVRINYYAGNPNDLKQHQMQNVFKVMVARMAAAELSKRICACDAGNRELYRWQFDRARVAGANDEQYNISLEELSNPFGTREGQLFAWRQVKRLAKAGAIIF